MEELSIEEKAKAYDEAFDKIADVVEAGTIEQGLAEWLFPELRESEDEKIRKKIIALFKGQIPYTSKEDNEKFIAWLEKQGHTDSIIEKAKTEKQRVIITETNGNANIDWDTRSLEDARRLLECGLQYINTELEKQDNKPQGKTYTFEGKPVLEAIDKIGEKKFADKVEPKFKIEKDKWYVCTQTFVRRCKEVVIKGQTYQANKNNVIKGKDGRLFIDKHDGKASDYFKSWTIKDAKAGDVLEASNGSLFILAKAKDNSAYYYFSLWENSSKEISDGNHSWENTKDCHPATKEQRAQLFQKMHEAGYEWDTEKKELKKIEQKQDPCEHCNNICLNCHNFPCINKRAFEQNKSVWEIINEEKVDNENKVIKF